VYAGFHACVTSAGLDPIGLEVDVSGLDTASIRSAGGMLGTVEPLAFASFNTYRYTVLTFDRSSLHVQVKSMPIVPDPSILLNADAEQEYENRPLEDTLSFTVKAQ
jgi:hypothetical protein